MAEPEISETESIIDGTGGRNRTVATFKILRDPPLREHILLVLVLVLLIAGVQLFANWYSKSKAEEWAKYLKYYQSTSLVYQTQSTERTDPVTNPKNVPPPAQERKSVGITLKPSPESTVSPIVAPSPSLSPPPAGVAQSVQANAEVSPTKPASTAIEISFEGKRRIENQLQEITERARHHLRVATDFYTNYYQIVSVMMVTGLLASIALLSISKNGWSATNSYIITIFIVMTSATAYYGAYIPVFKIDQNVADNKSLYLQYVNLGNEVMSYLATNSNSKNVLQKDSEFIHYIDLELAKLNNIAIGFDYSKIPTYGGIFESKTKPADTQPSQTPKNTKP